MNLVVISCLLFVLASYLGYPLWLYVLSRLRPKPWHVADNDQPVSVLLAAHNEAARLPARLENLAALQPAPAEIIVVLDGCQDDSAASLQKIDSAWREHEGKPRLIVVQQSPQAGKSAALNRGMALVTSPLVLFADARQQFETDVLGVLRQSFSDPDIGAVSGELCFRQGGEGDAAAAGLYWKLEKGIRRYQALTGSVMGATGAVYMIRRELFQPLRDAELVDDLATPLAVIASGKRVVFEPRAIAWDTPPSDTAQEWRRKVRTLTGVWLTLPLVANMLLHGQSAAVLRFAAHKLSRLVVPWALMLMLLASLAAQGPLFWFGVCQLGGYLLVWLMHYQPRLRRLPLASTGYFFVLLNLAAARALWLAINGAGQQIWKSGATAEKRS
jgi:cellulose synthase/poly-beta-1,6-N-acetylglucosamine synthase-like glycosyltransferase